MRNSYYAECKWDSVSILSVALRDVIDACHRNDMYEIGFCAIGIGIACIVYLITLPIWLTMWTIGFLVKRVCKWCDWGVPNV